MAKKSANIVQGTIAELADKAQIGGVKLSITEWSVITRFLEQTKHARIVGEQKPTSGKGRTSKVWAIDTNVELVVSQ